MAAFLATFVGCSNFQGTTAKSFLNKVRQDPDPNVRFIAYQKLASPHCYDSDAQKAEAVKVLIAKLEQGTEPVATRAVICRTLGDLKDPAAREVLIRATSDHEGVVRIHALRALGKVGRPEDATMLSRVMTVDQLEDCRIAAIEGLGELKAKDPRILEVLITTMDHKDPALRLASLNALQKITGKDLGVQPSDWRKAFLPETVSTEHAAAATPSTA
ncbi:HEAT repeat domain-containing protein, partial [Singulisphaera rosea]